VADIAACGAGTIASGNTARARQRSASQCGQERGTGRGRRAGSGLVSKEVRARIGAVKACYERALKRNPNLSGKIKVRWTITAAGTCQAWTSRRQHG